MERFDQKFGGLGPMIRSDEGYWVSYEDFDEILKVNEEHLFNVIKERNAEIEELKQSHTNWIKKADAYVSEIEEERLVFKDMQLLIQQFGDDNEELKLKNNKLFSLLVISTTLNLLAGSAIVLFLLGFLTV